MVRLITPVFALVTLIITVVAAASAPRDNPTAAPRRQDDPTRSPRVVEVVVKRFAFEPAEVVADVGEKLRLMVVSADGVHGIEIRKFRVKREVPRGTKPVMIEFTPTEEGRFPILCSEYCGDGHDDMRGTLVVQARSSTSRGAAAPKTR